MSRFMDKIRQQMVEMEYQPETIQTYCRWIVRFIRFYHLRHPATMGQAEARAYIEHLAVRQRVAASTQNQAVGALVFLYNQALNEPIDLSGYRAKLRRRLPETASKKEIMLVLDKLTGRERLMGLLVYGSGLSVNKCARLMITDVDFSRMVIIINQRETMLPEKLADELAAQVETARAWPGNVGGYIFPSSRIHNGRCWHVSPSSLQKAMKAAAKKAGIYYKRITPRVLRNSFGRYLLEAGYNARTVQELLGHANVKTTLKLKSVERVVSPMDDFEKYAEKPRK
jgi:integrase